MVTVKLDNREIPKRDVLLVDDSGCCSTLTLWDENAKKFQAKKGSIIAVKGAIVRIYYGSECLSY